MRQIPRIAERLKASALRLLPVSAWERALGLRPVRVLRDTLVGPSDTVHLAEGPVSFERLRFRFVAPYRSWLKARRSGIESRICRLIMDRCHEGSVCLDVGASSGFISLVMALSVGRAGRVVSFECDSGYWDVLRRNIQINGLEQICVPVRATVGSHMTTGHDRVSLDDVVLRMGLPRVDVVKIDVDGGDLDVLRGARELLWRWRPLVVVEMERNHEAIYDFLHREIGYSTIVGMSGEAVTPGQWPANLIAGEGAIVIPIRGGLS